MNTSELRVQVLLSLQRALLGAISSNIRAIICNWTETQIEISTIFDCAISEANTEAMSEVETEIMADFPSHDVKVICTQLDAPKNIYLKNTDTLIFKRIE